jgi:hypothetical protein
MVWYCDPNSLPTSGFVYCKYDTYYYQLKWRQHNLCSFFYYISKDASSEKFLFICSLKPKTLNWLSSFENWSFDHASTILL